MSDTIRDSFLELLKQGMTHLEAKEEFSEAAWNMAMHDEIMSGTLVRNPETFEILTQDGKPSLLALEAKACMEKCDQNALAQAYELWMNGWTSEPVTKHSRPMSWYWRRPSKRPPKPGRRFLSTNQAYRAMKKERGEVPQLES